MGRFLSRGVNVIFKSKANTSVHAHRKISAVLKSKAKKKKETPSCSLLHVILFTSSIDIDIQSQARCGKKEDVSIIFLCSLPAPHIIPTFPYLKLLFKARTIYCFKSWDCNLGNLSYVLSLAHLLSSVLFQNMVLLDTHRRLLQNNTLQLQPWRVLFHCLQGVLTQLQVLAFFFIIMLGI